jgi:hypothetical protein
MPLVEDIKEEVLSKVDSDLDAWESFYKKYKADYGKIEEYQRRIKSLEEEVKNRDEHLRQKLRKERGTLLAISASFIIASALLLQIISTSLNVWLYFLGGLLIGLGSFALLYLWTR